MRHIVLIAFISALVLTSCEDDYTPKPMAYTRISLPEPVYLKPDSTWHCPYAFEASNQSYITLDPKYKKEDCWYTIYYPKLKASIHLTYFDLHDDLEEQIEENRTMAMKHISKASGIDEKLLMNDSAHVYGIVYDLKGETASDLQFFATDSTKHFLRGSLYFNVNPNKDSLQPVIDYVKADIQHMLGTLHWLE